MTGLLHEAIYEAIVRRSVFGASQSFGIVVLLLLIALLIQREALHATGQGSPRLDLLTAVSVPLTAVFLLTALLRVLELRP